MQIKGVFRKYSSDTFEGSPWANIKVRDEDRQNPTDLVTVKPQFNEDGDADLAAFKFSVSGFVPGDEVVVHANTDKYNTLRLVSIAKVTAPATSKSL